MKASHWKYENWWLLPFVGISDLLHWIAYYTGKWGNSLNMWWLFKLKSKSRMNNENK